MRVTPALAPLLPTTSVQISTTPPTPCPAVQPPAVPFSHSSRRFCSRKTRVNYLSGPGTKPEDLVVPQLGTTILGYYVVTIGEQTGIFYRWYVFISLPCDIVLFFVRNTVKSLTSGVPGNAQQRYDSWEEAIAAYTDDYNNGHVETRVVIRSGHSTSDTLADLTARLNLD